MLKHINDILFYMYRDTIGLCYIGTFLCRQLCVEATNRTNYINKMFHHISTQIQSPSTPNETYKSKRRDYIFLALWIDITTLLISYTKYVLSIPYTFETKLYIMLYAVLLKENTSSILFCKHCAYIHSALSMVQKASTLVHIFYVYLF